MEANLTTERVPDSIKLGQEWHISEQLGAGGFASVFLAHGSGGGTAVVKLIRKMPGAQRELLFVDLDSVPNVIPILDSGELDEYWALVMPRAEKSLRDFLIEMGGRLTVNDAITVLVDIAETLVAVEEHIVHRDIKPENILLLNGNWRVADFGIARYADATTAPDTLKHAMTHAYAAPEQWRGERASSATDVYAYGAVAYEMLAGRPPFEGPEFRRQHLEETPEPPTGIPERLRSLVSECLYKSPESRPRPQNLLARLKVSMVGTSQAGERLQQANALAVARQAEQNRQESIARVEAERRQGLVSAGEQSLDNILALLHQHIMANASEVQASPARSAPRTWALNDVTLQIDRSEPAPEKANGGIPFEVVAYSEISVRAPADRSGYTGRSHSLWFCDAQEAGVFRWFETAFIRNFGGNVTTLEPFAMSPGARDAALALSAFHTHQVAWPFTHIDQGNEESFIERWIDWFAEAAQGQAGKLRVMPQGSLAGSWRRGP